MTSYSEHALASIAVLFIGISKAGFGGGLGMLTTPLCVLAFGASGHPPTFAIGTLLPLLCAGDVFSLFHFWRKWRMENLILLLPGVFLGVILGIQGLARFSAPQLNIVIGSLAIAFLLFQLAKERLFRNAAASRPTRTEGVVFGIAAGVTSTFAHGAGPLMTMFLIPQKMPKEIYMGTMILVFTCINWVKMPFFIWKGIITLETLRTGALYLILIPIGVRLGVALNRTISEKAFVRWVYILTFLAGMQLVTGFNLFSWMKPKPAQPRASLVVRPVLLNPHGREVVRVPEREIVPQQANLDARSTTWLASLDLPRLADADCQTARPLDRIAK